MEQHLHLSEEDIAMCADAINKGTYEALPNFLKEHLEACDACAQEALSIAEFSKSIELSVPELIIKPKEKKSAFSQKFLWPLIAVAASLLLFLFFHFTGVINKENSHQKIIANNEDTITNNVDTNTTHTVSVDNKTKNENKSQLAYQTNKSLEQLYNNYRGTYRSSNINIITPHIFYPKSLDSLRWENVNNKLLYVDIFDNQEKEMVHLSCKTNALPLPKLLPGLYYWKLINEQYDLLFVGKIIVE